MPTPEEIDDRMAEEAGPGWLVNVILGCCLVWVVLGIVVFEI